MRSTGIPREALDAEPGPQPGGRAPAPGCLGLLQTFINTNYDLAGEDGGDLFATPDELRVWLVDHGLLERRARVTVSDLDRALALREGFRDLIAARDTRSDSSELHKLINAAIAGATLELRLTSRGPALAAVGSTPLNRALGALLASALPAMIDGTWLRLKVCPGRHCGWVFYDHSRNNSGRWCSMRICGGREKARAHYRRHRE